MQGEAEAHRVGSCGTCQSHLPRGTSSNSSSIRVSMQFFDPVFEAAFGGFLVFKMGHAWCPWKA